jgi:hypothetical protein
MDEPLKLKLEQEFEIQRLKQQLDLLHPKHMGELKDITLDLFRQNMALKNFIGSIAKGEFDVS